MLLPELTQEQVVERGVAAKLLLSDDRFQSFFEETKSLILESIGNTLPTSRDERESLYLRYNALNDVLGTMQSYVDAAEAIQNLSESELD
jgi:hypothetical protein